MSVKAEYPQAVDSALDCLRLFGIDLPAHPTWEQVQAEYETVWQSLDGRPIESLIDLPLMTDPELQAAMRRALGPRRPRLLHRLPFYCLLPCRMVNISMQHGMSGASAHGYSLLGKSSARSFTATARVIVSPSSHATWSRSTASSPTGQRSTHAMGIVAFWTQPITTAIDFMRAAFRAAIETGDLTFACYSCTKPSRIFSLRNDPLDVVWRESEMGLDFARKARYRDVVDIIVSQQRFIATMQGRTATFSTFSDAQFDEAAFEAQLTGTGCPR